MPDRALAFARTSSAAPLLRAFAGTFVLVFLAVPARAEVRVDLELVLAVDASRSIDAFEYRLQRMGYAKAMTHPAVVGAITSGPLRRIAISYVEWSGAFQQATLVGWTIVDGKASAAAFARKLTDAPRRFLGGTSISGAIGYSFRMFKENGIRGARQVIDISGDGANNRGVPVVTARDMAVRAGITINGLAVLCRHCSGPPNDYDLELAFRDLIIGGNGAFVISADNAGTFADAVRKKLILEIADTSPTGNTDLE